MATDDEILLQVDDGGIATMTLNRPGQLNAFSSHMVDVLFPAMCETVARDDAIRVLVVTGAGRGFCSGADVAGHLAAVRDGQRGRAALSARSGAISCPSPGCPSR